MIANDQEARLAPVVGRAAVQVARNFKTEPRETLQEAWLWVLGMDRNSVRRADKLDTWIAEGKAKQAYLAIVEGIGRNGYGRREAAHRQGLRFQALDRRKAPKDRDQFDYSVALVDELIPLAENPYWVPGDDQVNDSNSGNLKRTKKAPGEWGNAMAMVMDVRRAFKAGHYTSVAIAAWLNGESVA